MKAICIPLIIGSLLLLIVCIGQGQSIPPAPAVTIPPFPTATHLLTYAPVPKDMAISSEAPSPACNAKLVVRDSIGMYGGRYNDCAFDILMTEDGGALIAGLANGSRPSHRIVPGKARLVRIDADGKLVWEKNYGGKNDASFSSIIEVGAEEYVLVGDIAASYERDETDIYLVKVDGEGNEIWSHAHGGRYTTMQIRAPIIPAVRIGCDRGRQRNQFEPS